MNPDTSEWMQPVRPLRVYIFAVRTIGENLEYLTIDGIFISALSRSVNHAETLIENHWMSLG